MSIPGFSSDVSAALEACIARYGRGGPEQDPLVAPLAVFDWDNTCIANDIGDASFERMARRAEVALSPDEIASLVPESLSGRERRRPVLRLLERARAGDAAAGGALRAELLALYGDMGDGTPEGETRRYRWAAQMMAGRTAAELEAFADAAIEEGLQEPLSVERIATEDGARVMAAARGLRILRPIEALVTSLLSAGWDVRVVSASAAPLVRAFARRIGLGWERVIGVSLEKDPKGKRLLPRIAEPFPYREGKVLAIEKFLGRRPHLVAGDSPGDLAMLRASLDTRLVVARTPESEPARVAREEGAAKGWHVVTQASLIVA